MWMNIRYCCCCPSWTIAFSPAVRRLLFIVVAFVVLTTAAVGGYFVYDYAANHRDADANRDDHRRDSAAVVTNGIECSAIGR